MMTIVIFMADPDESWNNRTANEIHTEFKLFIESGLIHIIIAPQNIYPNLNTIKRTKYDSVDRVKWRSKQNVDFSFLMMYCEKLNKYYYKCHNLFIYIFCVTYIFSTNQIVEFNSCPARQRSQEAHVNKEGNLFVNSVHVWISRFLFMFVSENLGNIIPWSFCFLITLVIYNKHVCQYYLNCFRTYNCIFLDIYPMCLLYKKLWTKLVSIFI